MKIKLFIFWLVFACLWLTSFSSAWNYEKVIISSWDYNVPDTNFSVPLWDYNIWDIFCLSWIYGWSQSYWGAFFQDTNWSELYDNFITNYKLQYNNKHIKMCLVAFQAWLGYFEIYDNNSSVSLSDYEFYKFVSSPCPTCPTCEDCSTCQGSLWACIEDNTSLENMNSSLQDQLSQCLANSNACDPTEDEDCYTWAYQLFHLFRQNQGSDFSLPITNNIFLPS